MRIDNLSQAQRDALLMQLLSGAVRDRVTFAGAAQRFCAESDNRDAVNERSIFKRICQTIGDYYLDEIDQDTIQMYIASRRDEGVSATTINRHLQKIRALLNRARRYWGVEVSDVHIRMLREPRVRVRWLTRGEAARLLQTLPPHLADMAELSLETGLRESNVTLLRWDQVDFDRRAIFVEGEDVLKTDKSFAVPLSDRAVEVLKRWVGQHKDRVFLYRGVPVRRANGKAFRAALARANIDNFRWHDLRHTWATWHVQRGTPLPVLQELGGWIDPIMVKRYAHYHLDHLRQHVS